MSEARSGGDALVAACLAAAAALYLGALAPYGFHLGEDGDVVYLIWRTADGHRPYVDFASGYTPGFFHLNALLLKLFGPSLLVLRWALVVVHAAAVAALYLVARPLLPPSLAAIGPLAYVALMPVFAGEFATFNIPYPAWYTVPLWALSTLALGRGGGRAAPAWAALAGALAGLSCAIKPNTGAFNLAALALLLLSQGSPRRGAAARLVWWGLLAGVLACLAALFGFDLLRRDARLLLWPVLALAAALVAVTHRPAAAATTWRPGLAAALLAGFAAVTAPWVAAALGALGWQGFLRDVLFIGTGHELFFYLPIRSLGVWDLALAAAGAALLVAARLVRGRRLPARALVAAAALGLAAAAVALPLLATMPEGFAAALSSRLQHLAFGAAILVHWAGVALVLRLAASPAALARLLPIAVGAPLLFLSIYPRSDFFHWMLSAPLTLILAVAVVWRAAEPIATAALGRRRRAALLAVPAYGLAAFLLYPGVSLALQLHAPGVEFARLDLERAPVVLETGRRGRLDDLAALVAHLDAGSAPGDTVLGFPNLHLVNFLADRHTPARYGSFHPGWPDHEIEASIVAAMRAKRTPLVAVNHDQQLFMGHAPIYYFLLRAELLRRYRHVASFGSYDVLALAGDETEPPAAPPPLIDAPSASAAGDCAAALDSAARARPDSAVALAGCFAAAVGAREQEAALALSLASRDARGAIALAEALRDGDLAPRARRRAARVLAAIADPRALIAMIAARAGLEGDEREELDTAIFVTTVRAFIASWLPVVRATGEAEVAAEPEMAAAAIAWTAQPEPRLRFAGAWLAGVTGARAAEPGLRDMLAHGDVAAKSVAATALVRLGLLDGVDTPLLEAMAYDEMFTPAPLLLWAEAGGAPARARLAEAFAGGNEKQRQTLAYLAAALGEADLIAAVAAARDDPAPRVAAAARFAAGVEAAP